MRASGSRWRLMCVDDRNGFIIDHDERIGEDVHWRLRIDESRVNPFIELDELERSREQKEKRQCRHVVIIGHQSLFATEDKLSPSKKETRYERSGSPSFPENNGRGRPSCTSHPSWACEPRGRRSARGPGRLPCHSRANLFEQRFCRPNVKNRPGRGRPLCRRQDAAAKWRPSRPKHDPTPAHDSAVSSGSMTEEIGLLYTTSDGENVIVNAIDWKEGDNVVLDELHFTTSFVIYRELERQKGVELRIVPEKRRTRPRRSFRGAHRQENAPFDRRLGLEPERLPLRSSCAREARPPRTAPISMRMRFKPSATSRPTCTTRASISLVATAISGFSPISAAPRSTCARSTSSGPDRTATGTARSRRTCPTCIFASRRRRKNFRCDS